MKMVVFIVFYIKDNIYLIQIIYVDAWYYQHPNIGNI